MRRRLRRLLPILLALLAMAVGGTAVAGAALVLADRPGPGDRPNVPSQTPGDWAKAPSATPGGDPAVRPLRRVIPPDLLVVAPRGIAAADLAKIRDLPRVRDTVTFDGAKVRLLNKRSANAFGVDPSVFRSWTPPDTARSEKVWSALAHGRFLLSASVGRSLRLRGDLPYAISGARTPFLRYGGSGGLGLPGVDLLVSKPTGAKIGLVKDLGVMINAPGGNRDRLGLTIRKLLGPGTQIIDMHEQAAAPARGSRTGSARSYLDLYKRGAARCDGLSWTVLAAIGQIESGHGRNNGPSSAGALGPMQFMPETWKTYGIDGDGDRKADIQNPYDAVPSASRYLCANGAGRGGRALYQAVWRYNHSDEYVRQVLGLAKAYARAYR